MRIGIVIPAHDAEPWIADAIGSMLAQTHADWSAIVVDDGSTDDTAAAVRRFLPHPRLALVGQERAGVSAARNRGMALCGDADALLFLDADDWLAPDALSRLADALLADPGAVAACGPAGFVAEHAPQGARARLLRCPEGDVLPRLLIRNLFANFGQILVRAATLRAIGSFRPELAYGEDWELLTRIAAHGHLAVSPRPRPVLFVRRLPGGAYLRMATDPASFAPCMAAIFANPGVLARFGAHRLAALRARAEAENQWVIGRALLARDRRREARIHLRRSLVAAPTLKRLALTTMAHVPR